MLKECINIKNLNFINEINDNNFSHFISEFLHSIKIILKNNKEDFYIMTKNEPLINKDIKQYIYVYFIAIIEKTCNENNINIPYWINKEKYYLSYKWFPLECEKYYFLKPILEEESPTEFKKRNLFVSNNVLSCS